MVIPYIYVEKRPITVASRSNRKLSSLAQTLVVGSNPTKGMDVCVYSVFVLT
jgi:hypothetical protein